MAIKKISRKDISKMSTFEMLRLAQEPYRRLFAYLKPYKMRFGLGILFGALYGAANGLLLFVINHVATAVFPDGREAASTSKVSSFFHLSDYLRPENIGLREIILICSSIPIIMFIRGLFSYLNSYCMLWVSLRILDDIRKELFEKLMGQSMEFFNRAKSGELIQTVFNQTRMAQTTLTTISSDLVKQPIAIISALGVLLYYDPVFTFASLVLFPLCLVPMLVVGRKVRKSGAKEEEEAGMLMVVMQEAFSGIRVVKTNAREDYENERFALANQKMLRFIMRWRKAMEIVGPLVETVGSFGVAAALVYAWYYKLGSGLFTMLVGGLITLYPAFKALSRIHIMMQKCLASTTKIFELMDREPAIKDKPDALTLTDCKGLINFNNVTFAYGSNVPAVQDITLEVAPGTTCALVGSSGAGKSTLVSLLLRLYDTNAGSIRIDGHDIRDLTQKSLRENIGIVSQDTFLFHDTIFKNIQYGRLDATPEEVYNAAKLAFAHDFILAQPDGYETVIGDKGCLLSGGQQQRISIARALLKNAPILLLDEATSALDAESEKQIQAALATLSQGRTVIAIAHRLATILKANQIIVMEHGAVKEVGTHQELFEKSGLYRRLYDLQFNQHIAEPAPL